MRRSGRCACCAAPAHPILLRAGRGRSAGRPASRPLALGVDAAALRDARLAIGDVWGEQGLRLARVLRLGRALSAAHAGEELGRVAADAGYADQAHSTQTAAASPASPRRALLGS